MLFQRCEGSTAGYVQADAVQSFAQTFFQRLLRQTCKLLTAKILPQYDGKLAAENGQEFGFQSPFGSKNLNVADLGASFSEVDKIPPDSSAELRPASAFHLNEALYPLAVFWSFPFICKALHLSINFLSLY